MPPAPRIALIHAMSHSVAPITAAFEHAWPQARRTHLLDDSLSADLAASGSLDAAMTARFITLGDYVVAAGAQAVLFTCSAFGPCIEAVARRHAGIPVLKPNEAMIDEATALARGEPIGLVASFPMALRSIPREFPAGTPLQTALAEGALAALTPGTCRLTTGIARMRRNALPVRVAASSPWPSSAWPGPHRRWLPARGCRCARPRTARCGACACGWTRRRRPDQGQPAAPRPGRPVAGHGAGHGVAAHARPLTPGPAAAARFRPRASPDDHRARQHAGRTDNVWLRRAPA